MNPKNQKLFARIMAGTMVVLMLFGIVAQALSVFF